MWPFKKRVDYAEKYWFSQAQRLQYENDRLQRKADRAHRLAMACASYLPPDEHSKLMEELFHGGE